MWRSYDMYYGQRRMFTSIIVVSCVHLSQTLTIPQQCKVQWNSVQHHQKYHSNCFPISCYTHHIFKWTHLMSCVSYLSLGGARCRKWGYFVSNSHNEYKSGGFFKGKVSSSKGRKGHSKLSKPLQCQLCRWFIKDIQQSRWTALAPGNFLSFHFSFRNYVNTWVPSSFPPLLAFSSCLLEPSYPW